MSTYTKLLPIAAMASLAFGAAPAHADAITLSSADIGKTFSLNYNGFSSGTTVAGLTAATSFTLASIVGATYSFSYAVANTTSDPLTSRVSSFGFNTNPDITAASTTGAFNYTTLNSTYPNGIGTIDVCFKDAGTGSCAGGGGGGVADGVTGNGSFSLSFAQPVSSVTLSDFFVRYQSITGAGRITSASGSGTLTGSTSGGTQVPEPGMVGLLAGGLFAAALLRRRRKTTQRLIAA